ncbi:MAG: SMP-30/gluconolactonase/LRE family protein [Planctomycetales bacterium]
MNPSDRDAIQRLDAYLDAVASGPQADAPSLDASMLAVDRTLRSLGAAPDPSPLFIAQLLENLLMTPQGANIIVLPSASPLSSFPMIPAIPETVALPNRRATRGRFGGLAATAALLLLTIVAGLFAAGPLRPTSPEDEQTVFLPASGTSTPLAPLELLWETSGGPGLPLEDPFRLAIDPQGNLWITDGKNSRFQIFTPDGTFLEAWGTAGSGEGEFDFVEPGLFGGYGAGAVAFDASGNIYVADMGNKRIQKFAPDRTFLTEWGSQGFEDGEFYGIADLVVDDKGRVYVADYMQSRIQVFDSDGQFLDSWSKAEGEPPLNPEGLAIDADGNIWVAEFSQNQIRKLAPDGTRLIGWGEFGPDPGQLSGAYDVEVDAHGRVFVAEDSNDRIQVFDGQGNLLARWGESGDGPGQLDGPVSIVLDDAGSIYVSDSFNHRVLKYRLLPLLTGSPGVLEGG